MYVYASLAFSEKLGGGQRKVSDSRERNLLLENRQQRGKREIYPPIRARGKQQKKGLSGITGEVPFLGTTQRGRC